MPSTSSNELSTVEGGIWFYRPNMGAAIFFAIVFGLISVGMIWRSTCHGGWTSSRAFFWVVMVGLAFEVSGFAIRTAGSEDLASAGFFATQQSLIVLAPLFIAAGDYLCITRLICVASGTGSTRVLRVPAKWITKVFVTCDIVTVLIQVSGTTISAGSDWVGETADIGSYVLIAGLALQTLTLCFFVTILFRFGGLSLVMVRSGGERMHIYGLKSVFISSVAIWLRCIYRLIEYATGYEGYLFTNEWTFYLFEALPMVLATGIFLVWYPPLYISKETRTLEEHSPAPEGKTNEAKSTADV